MSAYVPADLRRRVREHFSSCCAYCRTAERLTVATFEIEHILPRSSGGETVFENLCLACPTCNRFKATRTKAIDPNTQEAVDLFHPHKHQWSDHFGWNGNATEVAPMTASGRATVEALKINRTQLVRVRRMWVAMDEHPPEIRS